jgi:hypothetical protein
LSLYLFRHTPKARGVTLPNMPLSKEQLGEIQQLQRKSNEWFSIDEITKRDPELLASHLVHRRTGKQVSFPHQSQDIYRKLDTWAARLIEQEIRLYEMRIAEKYVQDSLTPTAEDDATVLSEMALYIQSTEQDIKGKIASFSQHQEEEWERSWSKLGKTAKRLTSELSVTIRLNGELTRLELIENGYEPLDRIGFAQTKIERFYSHYNQIPHPFDDTKSLTIPHDVLNQAIRLLVYVVFHPVNESRLSGYENKFVSAFSRYLTCPRDASSSAVDQVAALFEPFLKKLAYFFDICDTNGQPIWGSGLDRLPSDLNLTNANLKDANTEYWQAQNVADAVFRLAFQLRHRGAHEAHDYPYFQRERNAYFVFAALLLSCKNVMNSDPRIVQAVTHQDIVNLVRDLFVKIDELVEGPYDPRIGDKPSTALTRLEKLLNFSQRAQALWPTCSTGLAEGLESEYLTIKDELTEADPEADIESYLEDMRGE